MNIIFDYGYTCTFKEVYPGDVFSIGDCNTVYLMTDFNRYVNLKNGFSCSLIDGDIPVRVYKASLTLKPKT